MNFAKYPQFQEMYSKLTEFKDKYLLTFFFFTGARPGEAMEIRREDVSVEGGKLMFRIPTLKLSKKTNTPIRRVRFVEYPGFAQFPELRELWSYVQPLPNGFYIFGWLKMYHNPRDYIIHHLGMPAYFFRHNLFSLFRIAGGSSTGVRELKGALDERSGRMYDHLSKEEFEKRGRILKRAIM